MYTRRIPVDPISQSFANPQQMRPKKALGPQAQFSYIYAFTSNTALIEATDVTLSYCRSEYLSHTLKLRLPEDSPFMSAFTWLVTRARGQQTRAYVREQKEMLDRAGDAMPTSFAGLSSSANTCHLPQDSTIIPCLC